MKVEDETMRKKCTEENSHDEQQKMEEEAKEIRESELNEKWQKFILENEIQKQ